MVGDRVHDVIVIGGRLAGLTAGLFAARRGLSTIVVEAMVPGGHLVNVEKIEDFPGFPEGVAGYDLCPMVQEQAANNGAEFLLAEVKRLESRDGVWLVETSDGSIETKVVILATGARPRSLGIPGETRLLGKGVSHCASCDGPLFRGRVVGVAGGGDSALQEALTLATFASRVVIFQHSDRLTGQHIFRERLAELPNVEVRYNSIVEEILGENAVSGVRRRDAVTAVEERVPLSGLFVYVGLQPNAKLLGRLVALDAAGHVPTDLWLRTPCPGLFAVGDARTGSGGQAITAAGDGATAAIAADRYVNGETWPAESR